VQFPLLSPENVFVGQLVQFDAAAEEYFPASQGAQDIPPLTFEYVPTMQSEQAVPDVKLEAVPISHAEQLDDPVRLEYLPAPHGLHSSALPTSLKNPTSHIVQFEAPGILDAVPVWHAVQFDDPAAAEYDPGLHWVQELAFLAENVPARHSPQPVNPSVCVNFPAVHDMHDAEPWAALKKPLGQAEQFPSEPV